jgi:hypothetical protein
MYNLGGQGTDFYCLGNDRSLVGFYTVLSQNFTIARSIFLNCGPGSVVGIATAYGLDGLGIES